MEIETASMGVASARGKEGSLLALASMWLPKAGPASVARFKHFGFNTGQGCCRNFWGNSLSTA